MSPTKRDLVAEQGGQRVGLGIAADVAHQREIEGFAHVFRVHIERAGEIDRQHAGAQRKIRGLPHRKLGGARKRDHDLGLPYRTLCLIRRYHVPDVPIPDCHWQAKDRRLPRLCAQKAARPAAILTGVFCFAPGYLCGGKRGSLPAAWPIRRMPF